MKCREVAELMVKHRATNLTYSHVLTKFEKDPRIKTLVAVKEALVQGLYAIKNIKDVWIWYWILLYIFNNIACLRNCNFVIVSMLSQSNHEVGVKLGKKLKFGPKKHDKWWKPLRPNPPPPSSTAIFCQPPSPSWWHNLHVFHLWKLFHLYLYIYILQKFEN